MDGTSKICDVHSEIVQSNPDKVTVVSIDEQNLTLFRDSTMHDGSAGSLLLPDRPCQAGCHWCEAVRGHKVSGIDESSEIREDNESTHPVCLEPSVSMLACGRLGNGLEESQRNGLHWPTR